MNLGGIKGSDPSDRRAPVVPSVLLGVMVVAGLAALPAFAQPVIEGSEKIDFDRPEAWAMKRSASLTMLTGLGPPRPRTAGSVEVAFELGWNPSLSDDERRVGFGGTKVENMGRVGVIPRARVTVGLGWDLSLDLSYTPPIEIDGLTPSLVTAALERPVWGRGGWVLGMRLYGHVGEVEGDITCPADEAAVPPGLPGNEFGCERPSEDTVTLDTVGVGLTGGYWLDRQRQSVIHFGIFANAMDLEFQVDALTFGLIDHTRLVTDGWTWSAAAGYSVAIGSPTRIAFEVFYSPLPVDRPVLDDSGSPVGIDSRNDALFNVRALIAYRF